MKKIFLLLSLFISAVCFGQRSMNAPYGFRGTIYDSSSFATGSYTNHSATPSIVSNHIQLTGGNQTISATVGTNNSAFNQYITINAPGGTMLERVKMSVAFTLTSVPSASSAGIAIGTISTNSVGLPSNGMGYFNMTTSTGAGKSFVLTGSTNNSTAISPNAVPVVQNDRYLMTYERVLDSVYVTVKDLTTDTASAFAGYTYDVSSTANPLYPNTGLFGIASLGGTIVIDSISISSKEIESANIIWLGHSKVVGYAAPFQLRTATQAGQVFGGTVVSAGQSDKSSDLILHLPEVISLRPKQAIVTILRNDIFAGVATAVWQQNAITIDSTLRANGISTFWIDEMYETSLTNLGQVTHFIDSAFSGRVFHLWYPGSQLAGSVASDNIHPSYIGCNLYSNLIVNAGLLKNYSNYLNDAYRDVYAYPRRQNYFTKTNTFSKDIYIGSGSIPGSLVEFGNGGSTANYAISIGNTALTSSNTGVGNIAIGVSVLHANTSGANNVGVGTSSLGANVSGANNVAIGTSALGTSTSSSNTAVGYATLQFGNSGGSNTAIGYSALNANLGGSQGVAIGNNSLLKNTTGSNNLAVGASALKFNTTGANNIGIGISVADSTNQSNCVYIGQNAGFKNSKDNRFFINNLSSYTSTNLLYGDFGHEKLQIGAPANPLDIPAQLTIGYTGSYITDSARGTHGVGFSIPAQHYDDSSTATSATVTNYAIHSVEQDSVSTRRTGITYTNAYGWLFGGNPVTTSNPSTGATPTITNSYSVGFQGTVNHLGQIQQNKDSAVTSSAGSVMTLGIDTITGRYVKFNGSGGVPTLQQVMTAGLTLTGTNTILNGGFEQSFNGTGNTTINTPFKVTAVPSGTGTALVHGTDSIIRQMPLSAATYAVTITNGTNVSASTAQTFFYQRVGNIVHVTGSYVSTCTAATASQISFSLPFASAIANTYDIAGLVRGDNMPTTYQVVGDVANDRATVLFTANATTSQQSTIDFTYIVQ